MSQYSRLVKVYALLMAMSSSDVVAGISIGDPKAANVTFSGKMSGEYGNSKNTSLLNSKIEPDAYNYEKMAFDLGTVCKSGECNNDAITAKAIMRMKCYLGNANNSFRTGAEPISVMSGASLGAHSHDTSRPLIWMKELSIEGKLHSIFSLVGSDKAKGHSHRIDDKTSRWPTSVITFGMFPFSVGRGIAFGESYGTPKSFLVLYNKTNDFCPPGILLSNKFAHDEFGRHIFVQLYSSKYESKSASPSQTMANKRANVIGNLTTPWAGAGMDEDIYIGVIGYQFDKKGEKVKKDPILEHFKDPVKNFSHPVKHLESEDLTGKLYSFCILDNAPGKMVEFTYDSNSVLGTYGLGLDFVTETFEFGFEFAQNFGQEDRLAVDRDILIPRKNDVTGGFDWCHSCIDQNVDVAVGAAWDPNKAVAARATRALEVELKKNQHLVNEQVFYDTDSLAATALLASEVGEDDDDSNTSEMAEGEVVTGGAAATTQGTVVDVASGEAPSNVTTLYKNKKNRVRPPFTNKYCGFMFVSDFAYKIAPVDKNYKLRFAGTFGVASGDNDPSLPELDKDYYGFVGIGENYSGKRVPSVMFLGDRSTKRPFVLEGGQNAVNIGSDETFTDVILIGAGFALNPRKDSQFKPEWSVNILSYYKYCQGYKVNSVSANGKPTFSSTDLASRNFGYEVNSSLEFTVAGALAVEACFGMFFPGQYYSDIKGVQLTSDLTKYMALSDNAGLSVDSYTLGSDPSWMFSVDFSYKF